MISFEKGTHREKSPLPFDQAKRNDGQTGLVIVIKADKVGEENKGEST